MKKPQSAAQSLCRIGARGADDISRIIAPLTVDGGGLHDEDDRRVSLLIHTHAMVWFGISRALPVDKAMPLLEAHARCAHTEFRSLGLEATVEETTDVIRTVWHAYIEAAGGGGRPQRAIVSTLLRHHLASPSRGMAVADELMRAVDVVVTAARSVVISTAPGAETALAVDFLEFVANRPDRDPLDHQEDTLPDHYPLRLDDVARLDVRACADHVTRLKSYPPALTSDEHWRRRILREELGRRLHKHGVGERRFPVPIMGRFGDLSPLRRWLRCERKVNGIAWIGFLCGLASVAFWFVVEIPIAAIVCGGIGLSRARKQQGRGRAPAAFGLGAGLVFFLFQAVVRLALLLRS